MAIDIFVPDIGDFSEVEVIEVLVAPGDTVAANDSLITIESDKASMEIPVTQAGVVKSVAVKVGDKIREGSLILALESDAASSSTAEVASSEPASPPPKKEEPQAAPVSTASEQTKPTSAPAQEPQTAATALAASALAPGETVMKPAPVEPSPPARLTSGQAHASPAIRQFARELGVDVSKVIGTGRKGRITKEDVQNHVKRVIADQANSTSAGGIQLPPMQEIDFSKWGDTETVALGRIKKLSGTHLHRAWLTVPHVTQFDEADITDLEAFRKESQQRAEKQQIKLTFMPFLLKACAMALKAMPEFNASLTADGESLILKKYVNIGVAVDTHNGLVVPVLKDVDKKGIFELAAELMQISQKARDGKLTPADMQGGCFSISSLGGIGGTQFTPIVNFPEVAILGVSKAAMKPTWNGSEFVPRMIMPFALSYDHRVIDGAQGVRFTSYLSDMLDDIRHLLL
jgi:pyruvate dehydrogenase E2 component (dihydrolipoamide acetyltransferase)